MCMADCRERSSTEAFISGAMRHCTDKMVCLQASLLRMRIWAASWYDSLQRARQFPVRISIQATLRYRFSPLGVAWDTVLQWLIETGSRQRKLSHTARAGGNCSNNIFAPGATGTCTGQWPEQRSRISMIWLETTGSGLRNEMHPAAGSCAVGIICWVPPVQDICTPLRSATRFQEMTIVQM